MGECLGGWAGEWGMGKGVCGRWVGRRVDARMGGWAKGAGIMRSSHSRRQSDPDEPDPHMCASASMGVSGAMRKRQRGRAGGWVGGYSEYTCLRNCQIRNCGSRFGGDFRRNAKKSLTQASRRLRHVRRLKSKSAKHSSNSAYNAGVVVRISYSLDPRFSCGFLKNGVKIRNGLGQAPRKKFLKPPYPL